MHQTQTDLLACPLSPIGNVSNRHFVVHASAKRTDVYKNSETMPGMTVALSDTDELLLSDDAAMPAARSVPRKRPAPKSAAAAPSAKRACAFASEPALAPSPSEHRERPHAFTA